jgi:hypothetical protein
MPDDNAPVPQRGLFGFLTLPDGGIANAAQNVNALRQMWLDRKLIGDADIGPGDPHDFDNGAWHSSCHLMGAGGVRRTIDGRLMWLEISHSTAHDEYFASLTIRESAGIRTVSLDSAEGRVFLENSTVQGFVEGNSTGRSSARGVNDAPELFNLWRRQDFDQPIRSTIEGGKVWEHWCTTRDIRPSHRIGTVVLTAYTSLIAALGDRFPAAVARGRRDYGHPKQLCAMVRAGLISEASATWETTPHPLPSAAEALLLEAEPAKSLLAIEMLDWTKAACYYMFARKLSSWSKTKEVKNDLKQFPV